MRMDFFLARTGPTMLVALGGHLGPAQPESSVLKEMRSVLYAELNTGGCTGGCVFSGTCVKDVCKCIHNFSQGFDCSRKPFQGQPSDRSQCSSHGVMLDTGVCDCYLGFHGTRCQYGKNRCIDDCNGHGDCNEKSQCLCHKGYTGIDCKSILKCPRSCCGRGICRQDRRCFCMDGFYGTSCSLTLPMVLPFLGH
eukprot:Gregarina_sp_Poly_1__4113@NODE_2257_length_2396_cov_82_855303_g1448_i0_p1_GENE_NODE_2257_length_2396_cov_82_855303_g1448_i0NODE_2257_length_2396_cov_82_855303_g1448_i0_p1_ORF_typecomplete_len194_score8_76EGF_Tenascin/PF18720_1/3_4EGF_Tenascin/PF18720_1/0_014EGF_Tenascin/PF18720_1/1_5e06EGF_Tenascin/PF18720_1/0_00078EGF_2/PF07974_13/1_5e03EGF_2/PF07974_13/0_0001EGF_2/PF07974_13/2_9e05EGF_2/PF07974_13/0_32EGF_alliinase/PF04863_13/3_3e02EGF_alliinase/PF04863_13/0_37EGF_alliinase/PF04863_13/0_041EGF